MPERGIHLFTVFPHPFSDFRPLAIGIAETTWTASPTTCLGSSITIALPALPRLSIGPTVVTKPAKTAPTHTAYKHVAEFPGFNLGDELIQCDRGIASHKTADRDSGFPRVNNDGGNRLAVLSHQEILGIYFMGVQKGYQFVLINLAAKTAESLATVAG